jgi:integrase
VVRSGRRTQVQDEKIRTGGFPRIFGRETKSMTGHIRRRGAKSWELKFDIEAASGTGKRVTRYHSFKGTKREASSELVRLKDAANRGDYVDPVKTTLSDFLDKWEGWAATQVSGKTLERYRELASLHIRPHLGAIRIQRLKTSNVTELYGKLQRPKTEGGAGLAPRTIGHVHRLLRRVFGCAAKWGIIARNPVALATPPKAPDTEIEILKPEEIKAVLLALRGRPLYPIAVLGLATGMRRGEMVALRWGAVDLDGGKIQVERSFEQTNAGLTLKAPKTKAGRRVITIPPSIAAELRTHWRQQQELRLALGLGRAAADDLVFGRADGEPWPPDSLTTAWAKTIAALKLSKVTLHALRHTHVSQLISAGVDIVTVSRRIGHSNPAVTLKVYAHMFGDTDKGAAAVVENALAGMLSD